jgi:hypothetical protein
VVNSQSTLFDTSRHLPIKHVILLAGRIVDTWQQALKKDDVIRDVKTLYMSADTDETIY